MHHSRLVVRCAESLLSLLLILQATSSPVAAADAEQSAARATALLKQVGVNRGLCVVVGQEPGVVLELVQSSDLTVLVREPDAGRRSRLQQAANEAGLGIDRLVIQAGAASRLPYADRLIDAVITSKPELTDDEAMRALRPLGTLIRVAGNTLRTKRRPPQKGAGDWSHWENGPDNNPVSTDSVIKAPYMTQFMARPYYIGMPSITTAAAGRTFLAIGHIAHHRREWKMLNKLIARNGYNGTVLWEKSLPEGYLVHRSAFVATADTFYMINGPGCQRLDPQTGADLGRLRIPGLVGHWKWMVIRDGVLYALAGPRDQGVVTTKGDRSFGGWSWSDLSRGYYSKPRVPWGFGSQLAAMDLKTRKVLWIHKETGKPIDSRGMTLGKDKLVLYCPDQHLRCLNASSGEVLWTNDEKDVLALIEQPGQGLSSTPGFRSACLAVFTPDAVIIQGQTRMNVVAISTADGYKLWHKKKFTNNPNAIYVDGRVILGVGKSGSHVAIEPSTGRVIEDLGFRKVACTRLTASSDSFFVRGEGTLRYDRGKKKPTIDGAIRPACNDGALPANGLLYLGPWQCDCNLSLIGNVAKCSAGKFQFARVATTAERLERFTTSNTVKALEVTPTDWGTLRGDNDRSSSTPVTIPGSIQSSWQFRHPAGSQPVPAIAAGDLVITTGLDGVIRAVDTTSGKSRWTFPTNAPIRMPPTIADGRLYAGAGDGFVYCLEAATGRPLWRFRAAPVERQIMVYGRLTSTWPVNTGVLVAKGVAYFAAGMIDHDGTYLYAIDAVTGALKWQNNSTGHLNAGIRKGISAQGNLTIHGDRLILAGGNQISPAPFDLKTGKCLVGPRSGGKPQSNHGRFVGVLDGKVPVGGGRILFSSPRNVSSKGSFEVHTATKRLRLSYGGIPPAWNKSTVALVNYKHGLLTCCDTETVIKRISNEQPGTTGRGTVASQLGTAKAIRWQSSLGETNKFEAMSLVVGPNAVVAVVQHQQKFRAQPQWFVVSFDQGTGKATWRHEIKDEPLPGGLLINRDGRIVVTTLTGNLLSLAAAK